jgi:hypothetical protein
MGLFGRKGRPAGWHPVEATCGPDYPPAVLYFRADNPAAVIGVTVHPVADATGQPGLEVIAEWQLRRPPRYIAAELEWLATRSQFLAYESADEAAGDAAEIVKWLLKGALITDVLPELDCGIAARICNWDGQPFEDAEAV